MNSTLILYDKWREEGYPEHAARHMAERALRRKYPHLDAIAAAEALFARLAHRAETDAYVCALYGWHA
jgi:DNA polymerase III epsilon subunit-like protein